MTISRTFQQSALWILFFFFWAPLLIWFFEIRGFDIKFGSFIEEPFISLARRTLQFSFIVTLFTVILAYPMAIIWYFLDKSYRTIMYVIFIFPFLMGLLSRNYAWIGMLSPNLNQNLGFISLFGLDSLLYTASAVVIVMFFIFIPYVFYALTYGLESVRTEHIDSARVMGANTLEIIRKVLIPSSYKAGMLAAGLVFMSSSGYFITPAMVGGGNYDFIGNLIVAISNYGKFDEASKLAAQFTLMILPVYLFLTAGIIGFRKQLLGR